MLQARWRRIQRFVLFLQFCSGHSLACGAGTSPAFMNSGRLDIDGPSSLSRFPSHFARCFYKSSRFWKTPCSTQYPWVHPAYDVHYELGSTMFEMQNESGFMEFLLNPDNGERRGVLDNARQALLWNMTKPANSCSVSSTTSEGSPPRGRKSPACSLRSIACGGQCWCGLLCGCTTALHG
jgi:hypothetical protein